SQAIHAAGLIFVSGQIPARADGTLVTGSIAEQTTACIEGLVNILEAAGSELAKVTKVTVFITDMANFGEMNTVYEKYFGPYKPARSCVAVKELPKGVPVEVEAIALA
ncbi:protein MMF1, mitochondrial precursor, partial [Sphaerulina musiva SO2202]